MKLHILSNRHIIALVFVVFGTVSAMPTSADNGPQQADIANYYLRKAQAEIPNFSVVSPTLLRGSSPGPAGLEMLQKAGVKTIVDLRGEDTRGKFDEQKAAKALGFHYVRLPMRHLDPIPRGYISKFLDLTGNSPQQPVYVHCEQGKDRTGAMVACYRIKESGWSPSQAYREMLSFDFHPLFRPMVESVWSFGRELGFNEPLPPMTDAVADIKRRYQVIMNEQRNPTRERGANPADELVRRLQSVIKNL